MKSISLIGMVVIVILLLASSSSSQSSVPELQIILTINQSQNTVHIPGQGTFPATNLPSLVYTAAPHFYLASFGDERLYGLVHSQRVPISLSAVDDGISVNHTLSLTQELSGSQIFLVFSRGGLQEIDTRMKPIEEEEFLTAIEPTFGYGLGAELPVRIALTYPTIDIRGSSILRKGLHDITLQSNRTQSGEKVLLINQSISG